MSDEEENEDDYQNEEDRYNALPKSARITNSFHNSDKAVRLVYSKMQRRIRTSLLKDVKLETEVSMYKIGSSIKDSFKVKASIKQNLAEFGRLNLRLSATPFNHRNFGAKISASLKKKLTADQSVNLSCDFGSLKDFKGGIDYSFSLLQVKMKLGFEMERKQKGDSMEGKVQMTYVIPWLTYRRIAEIVQNSPLMYYTIQEQRYFRLNDIIQEHVTAIKSKFSLKPKAKHMKKELKLMTFTTLLNNSRVCTQNILKDDPSKAISYEGLIAWQNSDRWVTINTGLYIPSYLRKLQKNALVDKYLAVLFEPEKNFKLGVMFNNHGPNLMAEYKKIPMKLLDSFKLSASIKNINVKMSKAVKLAKNKIYYSLVLQGQPKMSDLRAGLEMTLNS